MTQKRNPTAAEAVQGVRKSLGGRTPVSYTGPEARAAMGEAIRALRLMAGIVSTLTVDVAQMRRHTTTSWSQASDLAAVLVQERGLNWRMAHQIVGIMVRLAEEEDVEPARATPELLDRAALLFLGQPLGLSGETLARGPRPHPLRPGPQRHRQPRPGRDAAPDRVLAGAPGRGPRAPRRARGADSPRRPRPGRGRAGHRGRLSP